ncbi:MAG: hypothetical protein RLZZ436_95 [Planctomycetota bacterium]
MRPPISLFLVCCAFSIAACCLPTVSAQSAADVRLPDTDDGLPGGGPIRRYDWFRNLWQQRRLAWQQRQSADQQSVVFLGDSITQGAGDDFLGLFPGLRMANRGISGDTTRGMLIRLDEDVLSLNPRAIVMLMGTNDLEEGAAPEVIAGNVRLILERISKTQPETPVVLCLVFPSSASKKRPAESIQAINQLLQQTARGNRQVTVVDTWTLFANAAGDAKAEEMPDLLHPNEVGYRRWAGALRPVLATLGLIETEPDDFQPEEGFESLFNGRDLTGWGFRVTPEAVRVSAKRWMERDPNGVVWPFVDEPQAFDGLTASSDGRYRAINGRLVVTTPTEGRRIQQLWTTREFSGDFTLKLEFRATPNADSGVFLREPQLQCRDFPLAGPWKELKNYRSGDWNELIVEARGGTARCTCNGEVLEEAFKLPATGPIGLEGDRGQMEYRRIRIRMAP